jgi:hypothetical protein
MLHDFSLAPRPQSLHFLSQAVDAKDVRVNGMQKAQPISTEPLALLLN